jgi:hypothetical protein
VKFKGDTPTPNEKLARLKLGDNDKWQGINE